MDRPRPTITLGEALFSGIATLALALLYVAVFAGRTEAFRSWLYPP